MISSTTVTMAETSSEPRQPSRFEKNRNMVAGAYPCRLAGTHANGATMNDAQVQDHIEQLVAEEHKLLGRSGEQGLSPRDHDRLAAVRVELDRYWDLLRQRRAREEFGDDPDYASLRDADTVEGYEG